MADTQSSIVDQDQLQENAWQEKKIKQSRKYNSVGLWLAAGMYPIWSFLDILTADAHLVYNFSISRILCAAILIVFGLTHIKVKFNPIWLAYPVVIVIGTNISYMISLVSEEHIMPYMMQFCTLFVCSGMLHIWHFRNSLITVTITFLSLIILNGVNHQHSYSDLLTDGGMIVITVLIVYASLIEMRSRLIKQAFIANFNLQQAMNVVEEKNKIIQRNSTQIVDSINYGLRIQQAILPQKPDLTDSFGEHLLFYEPKNVVSGDFYWYAEKNNFRYFAVSDCTGHGVPGAFMSMIGSSLLNQIIHEVSSPEEILNTLKHRIITTLKQDSNELKDGMDIGIICFAKTNNPITYSGSKTDLFIVNNDTKEIQTVKGDRYTIGGKNSQQFISFKKHDIPNNINTTLFMSSDGFPDQYGEATNKKFGKQRLRDLFVSLSQTEQPEAEHLIKSTFNDWKGNTSQIDDILVAGFSLKNINWN